MQLTGGGSVGGMGSVGVSLCPLGLTSTSWPTMVHPSPPWDGSAEEGLGKIQARQEKPFSCSVVLITKPLSRFPPSPSSLLCPRVGSQGLCPSSFAEGFSLLIPGAGQALWAGRSASGTAQLGAELHGMTPKLTEQPSQAHQEFPTPDSTATAVMKLNLNLPVEPGLGRAVLKALGF